MAKVEAFRDATRLGYRYVALLQRARAMLFLPHASRARTFPRFLLGSTDSICDTESASLRASPLPASNFTDRA